MQIVILCRVISNVTHDGNSGEKIMNLLFLITTACCFSHYCLKTCKLIQSGMKIQLQILFTTDIVICLIALPGHAAIEYRILSGVHDNKTSSTVFTSLYTVATEIERATVMLIAIYRWCVFMVLPVYWTRHWYFESLTPSWIWLFNSYTFLQDDGCVFPFQVQVLVSKESGITGKFNCLFTDSPAADNNALYKGTYILSNTCVFSS